LEEILCSSRDVVEIHKSSDLDRAAAAGRECPVAEIMARLPWRTSGLAAIEPANGGHGVKNAGFLGGKLPAH